MSEPVYKYRRDEIRLVFRCIQCSWLFFLDTTLDDQTIEHGKASTYAEICQMALEAFDRHLDIRDRMEDFIK